jgi:hypothetical protein
MKFSTLRKDNRQKGMALILAIGFLAILSILGAVVMQVSRRDLSQTATTLPNQRSLYAADRSVEYSMNRDIIMNLAVSGTVVLADEANAPSYNGDEVKNAVGTGLGVTHNVVIDATGPGRLLDGTVTDVGPRNLPPHLAAIHGSEFGANLYHVNVKSTAPLGKTTHVDASIVRLFKMDDDQIFRTSGGG